MRQLFWKQPYLYLMSVGKIETRTWYTYYRGPVLMCGSLAPYTPEQLKDMAHPIIYGQIHEKINGKKLLNGLAMYVGNLTDCREMRVEDEMSAYVTYREPWQEVSERTGKVRETRLYSHIYEDVRPIEPFEVKGHVGFWTCKAETIEKIKYL